MGNAKEMWKEFEKFNGMKLKDFRGKATCRVEWLGAGKPGMANVLTTADGIGWACIGHLAPKGKFTDEERCVFTASSQMWA